VAPVALAGAIVPGVDRFIVMLSAHADVFGVGITTIAGSIVVPPSSVMSGGIVPGDGLAGICGVESGRAAPLVGGPPGVELHTVVDAPPNWDTGDMVPVVVTPIGVGMVPKGAADVNAVGDIVVVNGVIVAEVPGMVAEIVPGIVDDAGAGAAAGDGRGGSAGGCGPGTVEPGKSVMNDVAGCADSASIGAVMLLVVDVDEVPGTVDIPSAAEIDGIVPVAPPTVDIDVTGTAGVPGAICPIGVEQVTTVPGIVGSEASGTGANVVPGAPGWVVAENGLGPLSGEVMIVPGVDESPMAVVPIVETCARLVLQPNNRMTVANSRCSITLPHS
jgi:hypothetical protein